MDQNDAHPAITSNCVFISHSSKDAEAAAALVAFAEGLTWTLEHAIEDALLRSKDTCLANRPSRV